jgi:hypothetical protein
MGCTPHGLLPHDQVLMDTVFLRPSNFRFECNASGLGYGPDAYILWPVRNTICNRSVMENKNVIHLSTSVNLYDEINMCQVTGTDAVDGTDAVCLSFWRYGIDSCHKQTHMHTQRGDMYNVIYNKNALSVYVVSSYVSYWSIGWPDEIFKAVNI